MSMRVIGDIEIHHWTEIQDVFRGANIFLGNGFSINISSVMNYKSLFDKFITYLNPNDQAVFKKFNSTNFEGIQNMLSATREVNSIFGTKNCEIEAALSQLKTGLLHAIKDLHPPFSQVDPNTIYQLSQKLDWFENIFTTNYDTFLYHILLITLDRSRKNRSIKPYQDFFRKNEGVLHFCEKPSVDVKNIYYLHGALFLHKEGGQIHKINRGAKCEELLELIRLKIHLGALPVFVSEGRSQFKADTISKSSYLKFCREAFQTNRDRLVIYGFSFSDYDEHLITDLNRNKRKLAIGLYLQDLSTGGILEKVKGIEKKLYRYHSCDVRFFDSRTLF